MLASARMRRRLAWGGVFLLAAGSVAALIVFFPNPPPSKEAKVSTVPGDVVLPDKEHPFVTRRKDVLDVASRFLLTAVERKHVEDSWELASPELRAGFTKKTWAKGTIPVIPYYPVDFVRWRLSYSFEKEVNLLVALFPPRKPGKRRPLPTVFNLTLQRFERAGHPRWLVSSFLPAAEGADQFSASGPPGFTPRTGPATAKKEEVKSAHAGPIWLLVPGAILGLLVLALGVMGINGLRDRRAYRAYMRERQSSS